MTNPLARARLEKLADQRRESEERQWPNKRDAERVQSNLDNATVTVPYRDLTSLLADSLLREREAVAIIKELLEQWPDDSVPSGPLCVRVANYINAKADQIMGRDDG